MQTLFYVWGPFLLHLGAGLGLLSLGLAGAHAVVKRTYAAIEVKRAQRDQVESLRSWACDADYFVDDVVLQLARNPAFKDAFPAELEQRLYDINAESPQKQLERAKPRRRTITER